MIVDLRKDRLPKTLELSFSDNIFKYTSKIIENKYTIWFYKNRHHKIAIIESDVKPLNFLSLKQYNEKLGNNLYLYKSYIEGVCDYNDLINDMDKL